MASNYYLPLTMPYINSRNAMIQIDGLKESLSGLNEDIKERNRLKKNEMLGDRLAAGDLEGAEAMAFRNGDLDQGMSIRKHRQSERQSVQVSEREAALRTAGFFQNYIQPEKDPLRKKALVTSWIRQTPNAEKELKASGIDPEDYEGVTRFVIAEAQPFMDQKAQADLQRTQATRDAEIARAASYNAKTANVDQRTQQAIEGSKARYRQVMEQATVAQTPEQWAQIQPAIYAAYGAEVPFEQRDQFLRHAEASTATGDNLAPTEEESLIGITREMKLDQERQRNLNNIYGEPPKGSVWNIRNGKLVQEKIGSNADMQKQRAMLETAKTNIANAVNTLAGSNVAERYVTHPQNLNYGKNAQAVRLINNSAMQVVYALSGKQTAVAELNMFLQTFGPQPLDGIETIKAKAAHLQQVLTTLESGVQQGLEYDEAWSRAITEPEAALGGGGGQGNGLEGMSDDDLLRELSK